MNDVEWTLTGDGGYWGYEEIRGQQFGSGNIPYKNLTLTSTSFSNVSSIIINTSGASSISGILKISVGSQEIDSINLTTTATKYTFDVSGYSGQIFLSYTQTSSKAIYIKYIEVNYAE